MFGMGGGSYWGPQGAQEALDATYRQVLERGIDRDGLEGHGRYLVQDNGTLREVVRRLALSEEFGNRFVEPHVPAQDWFSIIAPLYPKFLGRPPESRERLMEHAQTLFRGNQYDPEGYRQLVLNFINSPEYTQRWDEQGIPGVGQHPNPSKQ